MLRLVLTVRALSGLEDIRPRDLPARAARGSF